MVDATMVAGAIADVINSGGDFITAQLKLVGPMTFQRALPYYKYAPDGNSYPLAMVQHIDENYYWYSMPNNFMTIYQFDIYGLIRSNEIEVNARAVEKFAGAVKTLFMQKNMSINLEDGSILVNLDQNSKSYCPVLGAKYIEVLSGQSKLATGFRMRFKGSVIENGQDINANTNKENYPNEV